MKRKMITPDMVAEMEWLLAEKIKPAEIAVKLGISRYVVEVVARDDGFRGGSARQPRSKSGIVHENVTLDYGTIRRIQRMLSVGVLTYEEICRELGVSKSTVRDVASGRRPMVVYARPHLGRGERFLSQPRRCRICGANLIVSPCRACRMRKEKEFD
jgi:DNA-binding CsgD family transcriptional regulator